MGLLDLKSNVYNFCYPKQSCVHVYKKWYDTEPLKKYIYTIIHSWPSQQLQ